jgi:uncharacterized BrkB/YihY/UPF0761 family membrane protein
MGRSANIIPYGMPLFNKKIDEEYNDPVGAVATSAFANITDSIIDTHSAIKVLAITVTAQIGALLMFYVSKDQVIDYLEDSESDVWIYGSIVIFALGFLTAFAVYRLVANKWPHRTSGVLIWLVSIAAGLLNIGIFFVLINFQMK